MLRSHWVCLTFSRILHDVRRVYAEDGQVFAWGYPARGRLGDFFDTGSNQVNPAAN